MSEKELTDLIERIKERRLTLEMSYQDLSDATQISKSTLQRYETGYIKKVPINQIEIFLFHPAGRNAHKKIPPAGC